MLGRLSLAAVVLALGITTAAAPVPNFVEPVKKMAQPDLSALLQSVAAFAMTASFASSLLLLTKYRGHVRRLRWMPPLLVCVTFLAGGFLFMFRSQ